MKGRTLVVILVFALIVVASCLILLWPQEGSQPPTKIEAPPQPPPQSAMESKGASPTTPALPIEEARAPNGRTLLAPPSPKEKPRSPVVERLRREALEDPKNPLRWIELAKAYDQAGEHELALAALKRALALGVPFDGRDEVLRLVTEYEEYRSRQKASVRGPQKEAEPQKRPPRTRTGKP